MVTASQRELQNINTDCHWMKGKEKKHNSMGLDWSVSVNVLLLSVIPLRLVIAH